MKRLDFNHLEVLNGGKDTTGCVTGIASTIASAVGVGFAILCPPVGLAAGMLGGFFAGASLGFSGGATIIACFAD